MIRLVDPRLTRRGFIGASAAMIAATALPAGVAAQGASYRRYRMSDPDPQPHVLKVLGSYKNAIRKMLELPPSDPRNWFRNALVHTFDCPHGNWWFLPWHRAYLGYFERTCRQLSGDPEFALPYWDWTETSRIPAVMFDDVLDPNNDAYIATFEEFKKAFEVQLAKMWASFTPSQKAQLERRGYKSVAHFWLQELYEPPADDLSLKSMFRARGHARGLTADSPDFIPDDKRTAVSLSTIETALLTPTFARDPFKDDAAGFGSTKAQFHQHGRHRQGLLESQPHNNVHGAVGGFMSDFLSPVDPIFFLHHTNIDRLWDVWTRRQEAPPPPQLALPEKGDDLSWWQDEQFLFFSDENGEPVFNATVKDYKAMSFFNYDYEPGKGEHMVPLVPKVIAKAPSATQSFSALIRTEGVAGGVAEVPGDLLRPPGPDEPGNVTGVTLNLRRADRGRRFQVLVSAPGSKPIVAGMITVLGPLTGDTTYTIPIPASLTAEPGTKVPVKVDVVALDEIEESEKPSFAPGETETGGPQFKVPKGNAPQVTAIQVMKNN
jgi:tyrosinase